MKEKHTLRTLALVFVILLIAHSDALGQEEDPHGFLGVSVRRFSDDGRDYWLADIPVFETARTVGRPVNVSLNSRLTWGIVGGFSLDMSVGMGLKWRPLPRVTLFSQGSAGTFFLNNYTLLGSGGIDVDLRSGDFADVVIGVEGFGRYAGELIGYFNGRQWFASGTGVGIRFGIRFNE